MLQGQGLATRNAYREVAAKGDIGNGVSDRTGTIGTIKTLATSEEAFHKMAQLMADFQLVAMRHVESHIDDFNWTGFDIRYYKEGQTESRYGYTLHGVKTERSALDAALSRFELAPVFGGITKDEVLGLMLGEGD